MGLANSMRLEPNITPHSKGSMPINSIVHAHSCRQGGASKASRSFTKSGKPRVKFPKVVTKKFTTPSYWYVCDDEYCVKWKSIRNMRKGVVMNKSIVEII